VHNVKLTSSDVAAFRVLGMITRNTGLLPAVGDILIGVDDADSVVTAVDVGDTIDTGGATGVALARTDATDLAGMSVGNVIIRLCVCDNVMVSAGLMAVWLTGVTLGTG